MYYFCDQERIVARKKERKKEREKEKERQTEARRGKGFKGPLTTGVIVFSCLAIGGCVESVN